MDKFCDETTMPEPTLEFEPAYNRHYIAVDEQGRIVDGWSDGPHPGRDTSGAICIDGEGGYQFRLLPGGEETPPLSAEDGVPLYRWDGETAVPRTMEEIEADRAPSLELVQAEKLAQLSAACNAAIVAGCGVELPDGSAGHISLTAEDQINLTNAHAAVAAAGLSLPPGRRAVRALPCRGHPGYRPGCHRPQAVPHHLLQPPGGLGAAVQKRGGGVRDYIRR